MGAEHEPYPHTSITTSNADVCLCKRQSCSKGTHKVVMKGLQTRQANTRPTNPDTHSPNQFSYLNPTAATTRALCPASIHKRTLSQGKLQLLQLCCSLG